MPLWAWTRSPGSWSTPNPPSSQSRRDISWVCSICLHCRSLWFLNKQPQSQAPKSLSKPGVSPGSPGSVSHCPQSSPGHNACPDLAVPLSSLSSKARKALMKRTKCLGSIGILWGFLRMVLAIFGDQFFRDCNVSAIPTLLQCAHHKAPFTSTPKLPDFKETPRREEWDEGTDFQFL